MFIHINWYNIAHDCRVSSKHRTHKYRIFIDGGIIKGVENQRLLGIIIHKPLSWDKQIDAVCLNVTRRITLMKLLSKYLDISHLNQYYNSYILPIFDYACLVWGRCTLSNINRLIRLQQRAARIVLKVYFSTPSQIMFNELKWLTFPKRVQYKCIMMYSFFFSFFLFLIFV